MSIDAAFAQFPVLTTARLHLRQLQPTDVEAFFAIRSNREVMESYGQEPYQFLDEALVRIQRLQAIYEQREAIFWVIGLKGEDTIIGSCTFWNFSSDFLVAEIGYELNRAYWRQGIISEALVPILTYGFTELGLHRVEALLFARNIRSKNLLYKLGFTHEGTLRQRVSFHDHFEDELYFGLLKDEWLKAE